MQSLDPQGQSSTRAEQEATELLANILQENPLPEATVKQAADQEGVYSLTSSDASTLNCIAIIRDGRITPLIDLEGVPEPRTPGEKMHYFAMTARTILDGLMEALLFWEERRRNEEDEGDEGETCYV